VSDSIKRPAIQSVSRAISILRCFVGSRELGLSEISRMIGLHKSTTAGIINTLKAEKFLEQNEENGKFRLGIDLFCLAVNAKLELCDVCEPYLNSLLEATGETVNLALRDGDSVVYVEKKESPHSMRICTSVGKRLPLYCTAIGKAILAFLDEAEVLKLFDGLTLEQLTSNTITSKELLMANLRAARKRGVAYDFEELEYGLICVAAPIFDKRGTPVGAVSVSGPSIRMNEQTRESIAGELLKTAGAICQEISRTAAL